MPLLNNRRIPLTAPPPYDPRRKRKEVWYLRFTNEIFTTYDFNRAYINRLMLYHQPIWTCEATGRANLTYEQALESEGRDERNRAEFRFCETLRRRILHRILFQTVRLEPLVEDIYGYFKFNYAPGEVVHCTLGDATYLAKILEIIPGHNNGLYRHANGNNHINRSVGFGTSNMSTTSEEDETESETEDVPRQPNGRLRFPDAFLHPTPSTFEPQHTHQDSSVPKMESASMDRKTSADSLAYQGFRYKVQLINEYEMPIEQCIRIVEFSEIRRDKRTFCRHTIQRLIRECAYRDSYVGAPWIIKPNVARQYGIDTTLPMHLQEAQDLAYAKLVRKRKAPGRFADDKDADKRARKEETLINRARLKEEKERQREEKRRQAAVKYPMEDLDLPIYRKDPNQNWALIDMSPDVYNGPYAIPYPSGGRTPRPVPQKNENIPGELFEDFISVWSFLSIFSEPLGLLAFSIDEFERALLQSPQQGKSTILVESNACLLNVIIRERKDNTVSAIASGTAMEEYMDALEQEEEEGEQMEEEKEEEDQKQQDSAAAAPKREKTERGWRSPEQLRLTKGWDSKEIKSADRKGWETVLVGCLNDVATPELVPDIDAILSHLVPRNGSTVAERERQYPTLSMKQKLGILNFLVQAVNESMLIKDYMEECQEQLTEFRRQRVDLNKEGKSLAARRAELERKDREEKEEKEGSEEEDRSGSGDEENGDASEESEVEEASSNSEDSDTSDRDIKGRHRSRQEKLRLKQQKRKEAEALQKKLYQQQREAAKARSQELKQKAEERRKLEEEERALRKKEEQLERDMKKYMTLRVKPLGRDRFYNRYIYLDNIGTADTYGTGRLYIQSPSEVDIQVLRERDRVPDLPEQAWGRGGGRWFILELMKHHGFDEEQIQWLNERLQRPADDRGNRNDRSWWRSYSDPEDIHALLSWLNPKGMRENKLKNEITKRLNHMFESMRKREQASSKPEPTPKRGTRLRSSLST